jgi:hypothetical protein
LKATGVRTRLYEYESSRNIGDANFPHGLDMKRAGLAVFVDTDERLSGVSFGNPSARQPIHEKGRLLMGRDPRGVR